MDQHELPPTVKNQLHPRNLHRDRYDFQALIGTFSALKPYVRLNQFKDLSIDFADPKAVKMLNKALLLHYYGIENWDIPAGYLCPPIPGRADYIHYVADLVAAYNNGKIPRGKSFRCLDIGVGANCVYPIIGTKAYQWSFVGSDIDPLAIESANTIIAANERLSQNVVCRLQPDIKNIFNGIVEDNEYFDVSICNPPFHESMAVAQGGTLRKTKQLNQQKMDKAISNFGGTPTELCTEGGELGFVRRMIQESKQVGTSVFWFTTLISKQSNLRGVYEALAKAGAEEVETIPMGQGNKVSRMVGWTFLSPAKQKIWKNLKWGQK